MNRIISASLIALSLAACATQAPARTAADYAPLLADKNRLAVEVADDAARKPAEVLAFLNLKGGETVLELEAGRGYYTELLAGAVGVNGKVIMQSPPEMPNYNTWMDARIKDKRLPNVTLSHARFDKLDVADGTVDKVVWILGPHELYFAPPVNGKPANLGAPAAVYAEIKRVLKPGGEFIAMDHAADKGASPATTGQNLHRIDPQVVLDTAKAAGFTFVEKSDMLANATDDRTKRAFDPTIRRHTDQFLYRFAKAK